MTGRDTASTRDTSLEASHAVTSGWIRTRLGEETADKQEEARLCSVRGRRAFSQVLHFFSKDTSFVYHNANGSIAPMPPNNPKSGDYFDSTAINYVGSHRHHAKHWTSSQHLHCAFGPGGPPTCQSQVAIGGSLLVFDGFKLTLGTGRYAGATGKASSKDVPGGGADTTATIHLR